MTVGERIKRRREELGLTQDELAHKVGYKSRSSINKIELSRALPLSKVEKMAAALDTTPSALMGWTDAGGTVVCTAEEAISNEEILSMLKENADKTISLVTQMQHEDNRLIKQAMSLYQKYKNAPAHIQSAIETLLKSVQ